MVDGVQRDARRASRPARPGPAPARPGAPGDGRRPPRPSKLAGAVPLCPQARSSPLPRRAGRGVRGGEDRGGGGGGRSCGWPAARPGIRPAAGRGLGLTCSLSSAIGSVPVQPGFRSDLLQNMQNMRPICSIYIEICRICNKICTKICRIFNIICNKICRIETGLYSAYSTYICKICKIICKKICRIY